MLFVPFDFERERRGVGIACGHSSERLKGALERERSAWLPRETRRKGTGEVPTAVPVLALFLAEWRRVTPRLHC
jgi:hypothetical protein